MVSRGYKRIDISIEETKEEPNLALKFDRYPASVELLAAKVVLKVSYTGSVSEALKTPERIAN